MNPKQSFAAIGITTAAWSADDGAGCASNEPPFRSRFPESAACPQFKNQPERARCCL